jgi:hypothetical protein
MVRVVNETKMLNFPVANSAKWEQIRVRGSMVSLCDSFHVHTCFKVNVHCTMHWITEYIQ